jgi:serine/threonine protein phosphatase PrpC
MEDVFSVAYQQTEDELDLEYAFFGIYDGHGGKEAALFAKVPLKVLLFALAPLEVIALGFLSQIVPLKSPRSLPTVLTVTLWIPFNLHVC